MSWFTIILKFLYEAFKLMDRQLKLTAKWTEYNYWIHESKKRAFFACTWEWYLVCFLSCQAERSWMNSLRIVVKTQGVPRQVQKLLLWKSFFQEPTGRKFTTFNSPNPTYTNDIMTCHLDRVFICTRCGSLNWVHTSTTRRDVLLRPETAPQLPHPQQLPRVWRIFSGGGTRLGHTWLELGIAKTRRLESGVATAAGWRVSASKGAATESLVIYACAGYQHYQSPKWDSDKLLLFYLHLYLLVVSDH